MRPTWNIDEIEKLTPEGKVRNLVRQLSHEARILDRNFSYRGAKTSHGAQYINTPSVKLITWGKGFKAKAEVRVNGIPQHKPLSIANDAEQIYLELGAAIDAN